MLAQITGLLVDKTPTEVVLDCNGIGFQVFVSVNTSKQLPATNTQATLYTHLIHREDAMQLYGFITKQERQAFLLLTAISGIGPKSAIGILSSISISDLKFAIQKENLLLLQRMPGIGKKTAERLVVELKDKIGKLDVATDGVLENDNANEAITALCVLGYNRTAAEKAVKKAVSQDADMSLEDTIRLALKLAMK
ncbi:MAG: Holliday junction branch migration protein RuvA [Ignavibacteria bacterium]|jgi:Holliday junction DNA helicase RuvA|nr:Holliday junction branch migration protein RuvA [Ignavibacteria bacterium]